MDDQVPTALDNDFVLSTVMKFSAAHDVASSLGLVSHRWHEFSGHSSLWDVQAQHMYPVDYPYLKHSITFADRTGGWLEKVRSWNTVQRRWRGSASDSAGGAVTGMRPGGSGARAASAPAKSFQPSSAWTRPARGPVFCTNALGHRMFVHSGEDGAIRISRWESLSFPTPSPAPDASATARPSAIGSAGAQGSAASQASTAPTAGSGYLRHIAAQQQRVTRSMDVGRIHMLDTWTAHSHGVLALSADISTQTLVSGDWHGSCKVWALHRARPLDLDSVPVHELRGRCVSMGTPVSDVPGGEVGRPTLVYRLLEVQRLQGQGHTQLGTLEGHTGTIVAAAHHGDVCVTCSHDGSVRLWDLKLHNSTTTGNGTSKLWSWNSTTLHDPSPGSAAASSPLWRRECSLKMKGHTGPVDSVFLDTRHARALSGGKDGDVRVWDISTGKCVHTFEGPDAWVWSVKSGSTYLDSGCVQAGVRRPTGTARARISTQPSAAPGQTVGALVAAGLPKTAAASSQQPMAPAASSPGIVQPGVPPEHWDIFGVEQETAQNGAAHGQGAAIDPLLAYPPEFAGVRTHLVRQPAAEHGLRADVDINDGVEYDAGYQPLGAQAAGADDSDEDNDAGDALQGEDEQAYLLNLREQYEERRAIEASLGSRSLLERDLDGEEIQGSRPIQPYAEGGNEGAEADEHGAGEAMDDREAAAVESASDAEIGACGVGDDGQLIFSTSTDGWIRVYDLRSRRAVGKTYLEPDAPAWERDDIPCSGLALQLAHARFVTASFDGLVRVWDARMLKPYMHLQARTPDSVSLSRCDVSHDTIAVGASDGSIQMWDMWPERSAGMH